MGDLIAVYNRLNRRCGGNKSRFFLQMQEGKTLQDKREPMQHSTTETPDRYYGEKLQWGWWNIRIGLLPRNIEKLLDRTLSNLKQLVLLWAGGWARCLSGAPTHIVLLVPKNLQCIFIAGLISYFWRVWNKSNLHNFSVTMQNIWLTCHKKIFSTFGCILLFLYKNHHNADSLWKHYIIKYLGDICDIFDPILPETL